jgi:hypothetical protein
MKLLRQPPLEAHTRHKLRHPHAVFPVAITRTRSSPMALTNMLVVRAGRPGKCVYLPNFYFEHPVPESRLDYQLRSSGGRCNHELMRLS